MVVITRGCEHVWQAGWQLGGCFCRASDLPSSCKVGKKPQKPQTLLYSDQSMGQNMTGQSQTKADQGNLVPLGVENGLGSFKSQKPKEHFFQRHHSVLTQRHRQHKVVWLHIWFTPNQLLASMLKKPLKLSVSQCFIIFLLTRF